MKFKRFSITIIITSLLMGTGAVSAAINKGNITGKVIDKASSQPIPFVAVTLGLLPDTTIKKSAQTDEKGNFNFDQVADGRYVVSAYMVGYNRKHSKPLVCKQNSIKVETLTLENTVIQEVTVNGKRPEIELKADRTVLNVENSTTAAAENAYEVLRKAPGVNIDKDDNISLKGKEGVQITINDKQTHLSGQDLANYLKTLNGTEIEKVELITTPPARYEAAGNVGIINIKIKKNNKIGFNGSANLGVTLTHKVGENAGVSLNMRRGKFNTFGSINGRNGYNKSTIFIDKRLQGDTTNIIQSTKVLADYQNYNFRVGADYDLNKRHTFGVLARGSFSDEASTVHTNTNLLLKGGGIGKSLTTDVDNDGSYQNLTFNVNYKMTIDTSGSTLNVDADYVEYSNRGNQTNSTSFFIPNRSVQPLPLYLRDQTPSDLYIKSFRADYVHPFSKETLLEAGFKGSMVESDNNLKYEIYNHSSKEWENEPNRSNHFKFDENITAAYASLSYENKGWSFKGGLRAEHTWNKGYQVTSNTSNTRTYTDLFPSLYIQRTINKSNTLGISYNRRIDRPSYSKLNPFEFVIDEYARQKGNPSLKPQYTDNIEINHAWANCIFTSLNYSYTRDVQMDIAEEYKVANPTNGGEPVKGTMVVERNLKSSNSVTLNVSANFSPVRWFRTNNNITSMYREFNREGLQSGNSKLMYMIFSSNSFILPKQYIFEVMGKYNGPMAHGLVNIDPMYSLNLGLQKRFLSNSLTAKVSFDDVFNTFHNRAKAKYDNIDLVTKNTWSSQRLNLSLSYRFGSKNVKQARQRTISSEEEQSRTSK